MGWLGWVGLGWVDRVFFQFLMGLFGLGRVHYSNRIMLIHLKDLVIPNS